jgi:hypothetical protein
MFKSLGRMMGVSSPSTNAAASPTTNLQFPPPNDKEPVRFAPLTPFPLTGEVHEFEGYKYTTPSDLDFLAFRQLLDDPRGWTLRYEDHGLYSWDKTVQGEAMRLVKVFGIFDGVASELVNDLIQDPDYRLEWDANRLDGFCIHHIDTRTDIGYYAAKVTKPVANRDFVNMRSWREIGNGEYIIMSTSVPVKSMPPKDGFVRAFVKVSGYLVRPFGEGKASLTYVSHSDPRGWVPSYFVNNLTCKLAPNVLTSMRNALSKYPEWIEKRGDKFARPWLVEPTPWILPVQDQPAETHPRLLWRRLKSMRKVRKCPRRPSEKMQRRGDAKPRQVSSARRTRPSARARPYAYPPTTARQPRIITVCLYESACSCAPCCFVCCRGQSTLRAWAMRCAELRSSLSASRDGFRAAYCFKAAPRHERRPNTSAGRSPSCALVVVDYTHGTPPPKQV